MRMRANKPSSLFSLNVVRTSRKFYNAFNGDNSKIIFYGGIENDERLFEDVTREGGRRP